MKSNLITTLLTWVLAAGLVLSVFFSVKFFFQTKESRLFQVETTRYQSIRSFLQTVQPLVGDMVEYSKKDHGVDAILDAAGIHPTKATSAATTNKPAAK